MSRLVSFVFGGAVGVALGLLFAPRPGEETRAYVAERVDEYWGRGQTFYTEGKSKVQQGINDLQPAFNQKTDEMREKIDNARAMIAEQVSKNAAAARDVINDKLPAVVETADQVGEVVKGKIGEAKDFIDDTRSKFASKGKDAAGSLEESVTVDPSAIAEPIASTSDEVAEALSE